MRKAPCVGLHPKCELIDQDGRADLRELPAAVELLKPHRGQEADLGVVVRVTDRRGPVVRNDDEAARQRGRGDCRQNDCENEFRESHGKRARCKRAAKSCWSADGVCGDLTQELSARPQTLVRLRQSLAALAATAGQVRLRVRSQRWRLRRDRSAFAFARSARGYGGTSPPSRVVYLPVAEKLWLECRSPHVGVQGVITPETGTAAALRPGYPSPRTPPRLPSARGLPARRLPAP